MVKIHILMVKKLKKEGFFFKNKSELLQKDVEEKQKWFYKYL